LVDALKVASSLTFVAAGLDFTVPESVPAGALW
jgi:hypothetical protein